MENSLSQHIIIILFGESRQNNPTITFQYLVIRIKWSRCLKRFITDAKSADLLEDLTHGDPNDSMSVTVNEKSTAKVHYTGSQPATNEIFDTSRKEVAKQQDLYHEEREYEPLEVEMDQNKIIPGFEKALMGMAVGETKIVEISHEDAYGERNDEKIVDVPDDQFKSAQIIPQAGMQIQTSMGIATVVGYNQHSASVSLDFNHPLCGQTLKFNLEIVSIQ